MTRNWRHQRLYRRVIQTACSKLYRDAESLTSNSVMIAGTARSGTTWLADIIASQRPCRIMFEPFHSQLVSKFGAFHYFHYMRPTEPNPELLSYCHRIFTGDIRHRWIDRQVEHLFPQYRLIKEIRANLFLKWLKDMFPEVPLLFIVRHPCAVVASRLQLGWATDTDIDSFLSQPDLVEDFLSTKLDVIHRADTAAEKHALIWCIHHLVPFKQFNPTDLNVVFYEDLCLQPELQIPRIFRAIGQEFDDSVYEHLSIPSVTTSRRNGIRIDRWQEELSKRQIDDILRTVDAFGLGDIYGNSPTPLTRSLPQR
jgi:Sulfotransferase family